MSTEAGTVQCGRVAVQLAGVLQRGDLALHVGQLLLDQRVPGARGHGPLVPEAADVGQGEPRLLAQPQQRHAPGRGGLVPPLPGLPAGGGEQPLALPEPDSGASAAPRRFLGGSAGLLPGLGGSRVCRVAGGFVVLCLESVSGMRGGWCTAPRGAGCVLPGGSGTGCLICPELSGQLIYG